MACGEHEFYDVVVGMCSKCSDVCAVANDYCAINCPGYRRHVVSSTGRRHVTTTTSAMSVGGDTVDYLMSKPLFWTSLVSLCISAVATTVLVVLCICRRPRRSVTQRRRQLVHSTALPPHKLSQFSPASTEKTPPNSRVSVKSQRCEGLRMSSAVNKPDLRMTDEACIILSLHSNRLHESSDHGLSYNTSRIDHPQSSLISRIITDRPPTIGQCDVDEVSVDDVKATCSTTPLDENLTVRSQMHRNWSTSQRERDVTSHVDSGTCSLTNQRRQPSDTDVVDDDDWSVEDTQLKLTARRSAFNVASRDTAQNCQTAA